MSPTSRAAIAKLGWSATTWNTGDTGPFKPSWSTLVPKKHKAARALGFDEKSWTASGEGTYGWIQKDQGAPAWSITSSANKLNEDWLKGDSMGNAEVEQHWLKYGDAAAAADTARLTYAIHPTNTSKHDWQHPPGRADVSSARATPIGLEGVVDDPDDPED